MQTNYSIDEQQTIGENGSRTHGPNAVLSMLHHYLHGNTYDEKACHFHADNSVGQNKNKTTLHYLLWRSEVYNENDDDEHSLKWYRWGNFFTNYFKPPRGIGKFHHFRFTRVVFARETLDQPEKRLALLKESTNVPELLTTLPEVIQPAGLTEERMRYLYNEVRPFFQYNFRDEFCPRASEE
ncbi:Hypothetical predicted protein [Mytilus galloprovincialis]|uniref:Uncharacterized protein n=1 Tax=Mytilus galloprovincialis TaxID=29158 RepID=A0A8B6F4A3_MYTGA|nr:Hypothetical predicted protein [Mytilus galloprovincialis]